MRQVTDLEDRARLFATAAHASIGHVRKYTNEPYIVHPTAVVEILSTVTNDPAMLAAAWLHDTVEDTPVTLVQIYRHFGDDVGQMVDDLTDKSTYRDGNREARKSMDRERWSYITRPRSQTVKLSDLIHNTMDIMFHDPNFARQYMKEKALLLPNLRLGDRLLYFRAQNILTGYNERNTQMVANAELQP